MTLGGQKQDPMVGHMEVRVPVMVHVKDVKQGEELLVFWLPQKKTRRGSRR